MATHRVSTNAGTPVLMYHDVRRETSVSHWAVSEAQLREHLRVLREHDISTVRLRDLNEHPATHQVVLTFDDGFASHYEVAFPALVEQGLRAVFFVTTSLLGRPGYLTRAQLRAMCEAGMTIGSHGHHHIAYTLLERSDAREHLRRSREVIEDATGCPATAFSAPFGFVSRELDAAAREARFTEVCCSRPWIAKSHAEIIPRVALYNTTGAAQFATLASGARGPLVPRLVRHAVLHLPKQLKLRLRPKGFTVDVQEVHE